MRKYLFALMLAGFTFIVSLGAEYWLEPGKLRYKAGEELQVSRFTGDNLNGEAWSGKAKVKSLMLYTAAGLTDVTQSWKPAPVNKWIIKENPEGTKLFSLQSAPEENAFKYQDYMKRLEDQEQEEAISVLKKGNISIPQKETAMRFCKMILQTGIVKDDTYRIKAGTELEIIPEAHPSTLKPGDGIQCLILYQGRPLKHTLVKVWYRLNHSTVLQEIYTENDGRILFPISAKGWWMVSTVKVVPSGNPGSWKNLFASLTFGIGKIE